MYTVNILIITSLYFCLSLSSELNQWDKITGDYGEDIWYSTSDFVPVHSQSFGTIKIGRIMSVEFDFVFGGRTNDPNKDQTEMFFRVGYDPDGGNGCDGHNSAYPALWLFDDTDKLFVSGSDSVSCSNVYSLEEYGTISVGESYHIFIGFNDTHFVVEMSGGSSNWIREWDRNGTLESHLGDDVPIWFMSDKYGSGTYNRANGTFSNMTIISNWFTYDTPMPTSEPTANPTSIPSLLPTHTPTLYPTLHPTLYPTSNPTAHAKSTRVPTNVPLRITTTSLSLVTEMTLVTSWDISTTAILSESDSFSGVHLVVSWSVAFVLVLTLMILVYSFKRRLQKTQVHDMRIIPKREDSLIPVMIRNALAVIICIAEYEDNSEVEDLHGIKKDYAKLHDLFKYLNFTVIPLNRSTPYWWTEEDVINLLVKEVGDRLLDQMGELMYDALIVCISCHGLENSVITSNLRKIEKNVLHRAVSYFNPKVRDIPRIFIIDACDGPKARRFTVSQDAWSKVARQLLMNDSDFESPTVASDDGVSPRLQLTETDSTETGNTVEIPLKKVQTGYQLSTLDEEESNHWTTTTKNPDHELAVICSANIGFQAKIRGDIGSDFMYRFTEKIKSSVEREDNRTLSSICYEIQKELESQGRSLPEFKFNNQTRQIVFQRNVI